jgi:hypothetical protein
MSGSLTRQYLCENSSTTIETTIEGNHNTYRYRFPDYGSCRSTFSHDDPSIDRIMKLSRDPPLTPIKIRRNPDPPQMSNTEGAYDSTTEELRYYTSPVAQISYHESEISPVLIVDITDSNQKDWLQVRTEVDVPEIVDDPDDEQCLSKTPSIKVVKDDAIDPATKTSNISLISKNISFRQNEKNRSDHSNSHRTSSFMTDPITENAFSYERLHIKGNRTTWID